VKDPTGEYTSGHRGQGKIGSALSKLRPWAAPVTILLGILVIWELGVQVWDIPKWQLPSPSAIGQELAASRSLLLEHTLVTLEEIVLGFIAALASGLVLATAIAYSRILERSVYPIVIASQTVPIIAIAPLLLIWVGYGIAPKVIVVALICFYPIAVNTVDGLKVSGIKVGISVSVIAAVIGEWVGASAGLGYLITYSQPLFLTDRVFAAIVVLSAMGISLFVLASVVERLMLPWYYTEKRANSIERM